MKYNIPIVNQYANYEIIGKQSSHLLNCREETPAKQFPAELISSSSLKFHRLQYFTAGAAHTTKQIFMLII